MPRSLWERLLRSITFRSGYTLVPHADPRAAAVPRIDPAWESISLLHPRQIAGDAPDPRLIGLALPMIAAAAALDVEPLERRVTSHESSGAFRLWPGEHYRLLTAAVQVTRPRTVIEIGTYTGLGFLALAHALDRDATLVTYDVVPYDAIAQSILRADDFDPPRREQRIADLSDRAAFDAHWPLLERCDLLFMDGPKDGRFEYRFWELLRERGLRPGALLIIDDIRLPKMLEFWRDLRLPKLDLISFGHFTGTGLAIWE